MDDPGFPANPKSRGANLIFCPIFLVNFPEKLGQGGGECPWFVSPGSANTYSSCEGRIGHGQQVSQDVRIPGVSCIYLISILNIYPSEEHTSTKPIAGSSNSTSKQTMEPNFPNGV